MTRDECVSMMQMQLSFRTNLSSQLISCLQLAQIDLEASPTLPWFLLSEDSFASTSAGEQRIAIPTDFLQEDDRATLRYLPTSTSSSNPEVDLDKDDYDILRINFFDDSTGTIKVGPPEAYALLNNYFRIFPTPDAIYVLHMIYYAKDSLLTTNIENKWTKYVPKLIMGIAGKMISNPVRDQGAYNEFSRWEAEGRAQLLVRDVSRDLANRNLQVGGPH